jgi:hypothetical protein
MSRALVEGFRACRVPLLAFGVAAALAIAANDAGIAAQGSGAPAGQVPAGRAGGRGAPQGGMPIAYDDRTGFRSIFDGSTLSGWDGDPTFWRAENGTIVGQSTAEHPITQNTFLIWRGGEPADFDLKVEYRINATNSGVQYRSVQLSEGGAQNIGKWVLKGYQADIDYANQYTGQLYEERGRGFLALRGSFGYFGPDAAGPRGPLAALENSDALKGIIKPDDWNQLEILARGNVLIHVLNGHVSALFVDDDTSARAAKGWLGFQLHMGAPMKVEFRNVYLKTL